jgi:membrane peptidoglycan carboxypeptidase
MATGFQAFQTGGGRTTPYLITSVRSTRGDILYSHAASAPTPVLDPLFATRMVEMLKGVIQAGTGTGANIGRPAAGKTGTSQNWRDAWFIGFTPDWICGVWVGNDDGAPMNQVTGGAIPAQIWRRMMVTAHANLEPHDFAWMAAAEAQRKLAEGGGEADVAASDEAAMPDAASQAGDDSSLAQEPGPAVEDAPSPSAADYAPRRGQPPDPNP